MKNTTETKALIVIAAVRLTRPVYGSLGADTIAVLTDAGYTVKESKAGFYNIGQGSSEYLPSDSFGILMGLRAVAQRSVDGWAVSGLKIENKPARVKDILKLGKRVKISVAWDK